MIVKNEAANLERCLRSVVGHIDCWVITDTGSTDGTPETVRRFFDDHGVPGELHHAPFENFSQARNAALENARASYLAFDYLLFADADMELKVAEPAFRSGLVAEAYQVKQESGVSYWNTRLLRRDVEASFVGVTHEFLDLKAGTTLQADGIAFIDHQTGANRPGKFARDTALLLQGLKTETDPGLRARYTFYLANSLRDDGDRVGALQRYAERARMGYWQEEVFMSLFNAAELQAVLGYAVEDVLATFEAATTACPSRAEALHGAARVCRDRGFHERGYQFALRGLSIPMPRAGLFVSEWVYTFGLLDEGAVNAYWAGRYRESLDLALRALQEGHVPASDQPRFLTNMRFAFSRLPAST